MTNEEYEKSCADILNPELNGIAFYEDETDLLLTFIERYVKQDGNAVMIQYLPDSKNMMGNPKPFYNVFDRDDYMMGCDC